MKFFLKYQWVDFSSNFLLITILPCLLRLDFLVYPEAEKDFFMNVATMEMSEEKNC